MFDLDELETKDPSPDADELQREEARRAAEKLQDKMFNIRRDACKALAAAGHFAEPYLQQLKDVSETDDDLDVKKAARNAVRELREQGVVLKKAEDDFKLPDPKQQAIDEQNQVWATRAGKQLLDKSWNVRKDACKRMGTVGKAAEPYLPKLRELLQDARPEVCKAAQAALKKLADEGICPPESEPQRAPPPPAAAAPVAEAAATAWPEADAGAGAGGGGFDACGDAGFGAPQPEADVTSEWWEALPGGPAWDPDAKPIPDTAVLLEQMARDRVIPKEEKVVHDPKAMMRETAQMAAEELTDSAVSVRRDACKVFGGLGKYAKPYLERLKEVSQKDPAPDVRIAAKSALKELREDGVGAQGASGSQAVPAKVEAKVAVLPPSPSWTGPVANFRIFDEVLPMLMEREGMTPAEVVKIWEEQWRVRGANRVRFQVQPPEEATQEEAAAAAWLNPREDAVPLEPAVVRLEAKVGSVLSQLAVAFKLQLGHEDMYREERLNRRRDPRSKLWIEGPPLIQSHRTRLAVDAPAVLPQGDEPPQLPEPSGMEPVEID